MLESTLEVSLEEMQDYEARLRSIAEELEKSGQDDSAKMLLFAAALIFDKIKEISKNVKNPKVFEC